jgi:hypothetical protein
LWHIYNASAVYMVNIICSTMLSGRVAETFDQKIQKMNSEDVEQQDKDTLAHSINAISQCVLEKGMLDAIQDAYKADTLIAPLLNKSVKHINTSHGKYILVNDIVYYVTKDQKYLVYIPATATLSGQESSDSTRDTSTTLPVASHDASNEDSGIEATSKISLQQTIIQNAMMHYMQVILAQPKLP